MDTLSSTCYVHIDVYVPVPPCYSSHNLTNYKYYHYVRQTCHDHFMNNKQISVLTHTTCPMSVFMITVTATIINFMEQLFNNSITVISWNSYCNGGSYSQSGSKCASFDSYSQTSMFDILLIVSVINLIMRTMMDG